MRPCRRRVAGSSSRSAPRASSSLPSGTGPAGARRRPPPVHPRPRGQPCRASRRRLGSGALPVLYKHARTAGFVYQAVLRGELTERLGVAWGSVHNGYAEIDGLTDCPSTASPSATPTSRVNSAPPTRSRHDRRRAAPHEDRQGLHHRSCWRYAQAMPSRRVSCPASTPRRRSPPRRATGTPSRTTTSGGWSMHDCSRWADGVPGELHRRGRHQAWCESSPPGMRPHSTFPRISPTRQSQTNASCPSSTAPSPSSRPSSRSDRRHRGVAQSPRPPVVDNRDARGRTEIKPDYAAASRGVGAGRIPPAAVDAVADRADLSGEQHDMVRTITTSGDGIDVVVGRARYRQDLRATAAAEVWRAAGFRPIGTYWRRAAAELGDRAAGLRSTTVAQFLDADLLADSSTTATCSSRRGRGWWTPAAWRA